MAVNSAPANGTATVTGPTAMSYQPAAGFAGAARAQAMMDALRSELGDAVEFTPPAGGLFLWLRLTGKGGQLADSAAFAKKAIEQGVAFVPGAPFFSQNPDTATLRLSFATADEARIREGVQRLKRALEAVHA